MIQILSSRKFSRPSIFQMELFLKQKKILVPMPGKAFFG